ncbi:hypothetical protein ANN_13149 [Periplaneta americana]|uniref:Uncharacterized protein n=1 Tax=Periplaneta americana TaxID=6978 RepID=A0ABQ8TJK8_PERAM|nr:hypothetical protein ANN_13149 [Periplaneta americana]
MHTIQRRPQTNRTGRKIEEVAMLVRADRFQSVDDLSAPAGTSHGTCHKILSDDLNMSLGTQHSVPRVLTQDHVTIVILEAVVIVSSSETFR